ncbi:25753_t:CDS:1, partial [Gigaspora margarita]
MDLLQKIIEAQQIFVKRLKAQDNNQKAITKKVKIIHSGSDNEVQESGRASLLLSNKDMISLLQNNTTNKVDNE